MHLRQRLLTSIIGIVSIAAAASLAAAPTIEETVIAPAHGRDTTYTQSPRGMHLAAVRVHGAGQNWVVTVDGVDGPPFDQILNAAVGFTTTYRKEFFRWEKSPPWNGPVAFTPDGTRHAYVARNGEDVVVMLDGKELFRSRLMAGVPPVTNLHFSPDGKRLIFLERTSDTAQSNRLMIDAKPASPAFDGIQLPFFSEDGVRWGLLGANAKQPAQKFLIIDGKDVGYIGEAPRFTPDGKRVVCIGGSIGDQALLVDGKPLVKGISIKHVAISSAGDIGTTVVVDRAGKQQCFLNNKTVAENATDFVFSPDGKHWAVTGGFNQIAWIIVDGKKHREYAKVSPPGFSPDSSKCIYTADRDGKRFVVVNGQADAGNILIHLWPTFSDTGSSVLYTAGDMMGKLRVHYNDHVEPVKYVLQNPSMTPDGGHYTYYGGDAAGDPNYTQFIVDGVEKVRAPKLGGQTFYSPDSQHIAAAVVDSIWVDDTAIPLRHRPLGFTDDSQHFVHSVAVTDATGAVVDTYYVDGNLVATFSSVKLNIANAQPRKMWESQPDGSIVFVGQEPSSANSGTIKRIKVTPAAGSSMAQWSANVSAAAAKSVADAAAANAKAKADQIAAAEQAKADAAEAAAQRKAANDAAVAARLKAREEAVAAKTKARQEALAAQAKARADAAAAKAKK